MIITVIALAIGIGIALLVEGGKKLWAKRQSKH